MLKTVWLTEQRNTGKGVAMLLGGFDGLHVGHRLLLQRAKESGYPVGVMTIVGGKTDGNLFTFFEREYIFRNSGVDFVFELPFEEIKHLSPQAFLQTLIGEFSPALFVCGEDFRFGAGACGTPETIKSSTQVPVEVIPLVEIGGEKVSSGTIKKMLQAGKTENVKTLLGEPFSLIGEVVKDRQVGRSLGFPTANIFYPKEKFPLKEGVYEACAEIDGKVYKAITNYGARPTFGDNTVVTESYFDGFSGDLYGKVLQIQFVRYLRGVQKFDGVESLKAQLQEDLRRIREGD